MGSTVFVKVVGFRDVERHALNTVFRLSMERPTTYALWTPEAPVMPHIALIDVESYEAGLALASPSLNPNLKLICVGHGAPARAWRVFARPLNWSAVIHAMDQLFATGRVDIDIGAEAVAPAPPPPGVRRTLIVEPSRDDRLYFRARLAIAGLVEVDEVETVAQASARVREQRYDVVILNVDILDEPWALVERLVSKEPPVGSVVVTTGNHAWAMHERAEHAGCRAVINRPYDPAHVARVLQMV